MNINEAGDRTVIPSISDKTADSANLAAIDSQVQTCRFPFIVAWGKWLGFTPKSVLQTMAQAEADNAPPTVIQKIDDKWLTLDDIENDTNRRHVEQIAAKGRGWTR